MIKRVIIRYPNNIKHDFRVGVKTLYGKDAFKPVGRIDVINNSGIVKVAIRDEENALVREFYAQDVEVWY